MMQTAWCTRCVRVLPITAATVERSLERDDVLEGTVIARVVYACGHGGLHAMSRQNFDAVGRVSA